MNKLIILSVLRQHVLERYLLRTSLALIRAASDAKSWYWGPHIRYTNYYCKTPQ